MRHAACARPGRRRWPLADPEPVGGVDPSVDEPRFRCDINPHFVARRREDLMNRTLALFVSIVVASTVSAGCIADAALEDDGESLATVSQAVVSGTDIQRSLVVTDPQVLARFSFARMFNKLRATALEPGQTLATTETS